MPEEVPRFEIYKLAFQHTEGEVGALWQRNQAFLLASSLLAVLVGQVIALPWLAFWISIFCVTISYLWYRANAKQHEWERYWIRRCQELEQEIANCDLWTHAKKKRLGRPSVKWDRHEKYLSAVFMLGWIAVSCYCLFKALKKM